MCGQSIRMQTMKPTRSSFRAFLTWSPPGRTLVFFLAASSIWSLLSEFYRICSMQRFTLYVEIPATAALILIALIDLAKGDRRLWRAVVIGAVGGLLAALAYDLYRLPWVIAAIDRIGPMCIRLPLYKVFPQFGAMILGRPYSLQQTDSQYKLLTHAVGWIYHFSNGVTFGIMYMALIGDPAKRSWLWAIVLAVGLELAMLFTPYTRFFGIGMTVRFVVATLTAHLIFGIVLGLFARREARNWSRYGFALIFPQLPEYESTNS